MNEVSTRGRAINPELGCLLLTLFSENVDARTIGEFLNLVDAYDDFTTLSVDSQGKCITPSTSER
ncbi:hypothetical protein HanXRQr2_Chr13g0602561 [Helianthus annuus]|uniref:Uncharacterized protein n=2 Tax=Helianthus annuus TaxID=4232 RepID=A0A9K3EJT8_HELAN|nr:hypothetical protein HanXRQr2_Chr13g0602561 [Helianthus annuus]